MKHVKAAKRFARDHPNIIVGRADKGNATVLVSRDEYFTAMSAMFGDEAVYKKIPRDPTSRVEGQCKNIIKALVEEGAISKRRSYSLKNSNCVAPKAYGLRKTHKVGTIAYRPVVSNIGSPCYNLSRYVHEELAKICSTFHRNMKDSFQVVQILKDTIIPKDHVLISLDVVSLFPSIPKELVVEKLRKHWRWLENYVEPSKELFIRMVSFIFESSYFIFDGQFYSQIQGTMMGNPASPSIANVIMDLLISEVLESLDFQPGISVYYVDDSLYSVPGNKVDEFVSAFNRYHPSLKFTHELEQDRKLAFLDIEVSRTEEGDIYTNWYTKPTASGRVLNYHSSHPMHQKVNNIKNMVYRARELSSPVFLQENLGKIRGILKNNNYPRYLYNRVINEYLAPTRKRPPRKDEEIPTSRCTFPNIPILTSKLQKLMLQDAKCELIPYNFKTTEILFTKIKHQEPRTEKKEIVYEIPCRECTCVYVGETRQKIHTRMKQHKYTCKRTYQGTETALSSHCKDNDHNMNFDDFAVLGVERNDQKRKLLECVHIIKRQEKSMNFKTDSENLSSVYTHLIRKE